MGDDTPAEPAAMQGDEKKVQGHVGEAVRSSAEKTLNALLDVEANQLCRAQRYEHSPERINSGRSASSPARPS